MKDGKLQDPDSGANAIGAPDATNSSVVSLGGEADSSAPPAETLPVAPPISEPLALAESSYDSEAEETNEPHQEVAESLPSLLPPKRKKEEG